MRLDQLQANWEEFGRSDPLWAILTESEKRGNRWDPQAFFARGDAEVAALMARLSALGVEVGRERALDFGCGVGRLSQALCRYFGHVVGVDIAESMIVKAREWNRHGDCCSYVHNTDPDLRQLGSETFDLIYTRLVLQHMRPEYALGYVREFVRLLRPGGVAVFQIPTGRMPGLGPLLRDLRSRIGVAVARIREPGRAEMEMYSVPADEVRRVVSGAGGVIFHVDDDDGTGALLASALYYCRRADGGAIAAAD